MMRKFSERGQSWVEYGLIIGLIAVIVLAIIIALGPQIAKVFGPYSADQESIGTQTQTAQ